MKNKFLFWLLTLFTLVNIADAFTALFILPGESNPLFLMANSLWPVILLKIVLVAIFWWIYNVNTYNYEQTYFNFVAIVVLATFIISLGVYSNVIGIQDPNYMEQVSEVSNEVKLNFYVKVVGVFYLMPWAFASFIFWIYNRSKKYVKIDKNFMVPLRFKKYAK